MKNVKMKGLSGREMAVVSSLELEGKRFFSKSDIRRFFCSAGEMAVYIHRLRRKGRIERVNKDRYYLIPLQAYHGWVEHPFVVADEIFGGKAYYIGGKAAAHYWRLTDQVPAIIDVFSHTRQGTKKILGTVFTFRRIRKMRVAVRREINGHHFLIATRKESNIWK